MTTDPATPLLQEKECCRCRVVRPLEEFGRRAASRDGRTAYCRECKSRDDAGYRERHRVHLNLQMKAKHLRRQFGMTLEDYSTLLAKQGGGCAICGAPEPNDRRHPVDHDHVTGAIRGVLCSRCNRVLGLLGDDPELLRAALMYLEVNGGG